MTKLEEAIQSLDFAVLAIGITDNEELKRVVDIILEANRELTKVYLSIRERPL